MLDWSSSQWEPPPRNRRESASPAQPLPAHTRTIPSYLCKCRTTRFTPIANPSVGVQDRLCNGVHHGISLGSNTSSVNWLSYLGHAIPHRGWRPFNRHRLAAKGYRWLALMSSGQHLPARSLADAARGKPSQAGVLPPEANNSLLWVSPRGVCHRPIHVSKSRQRPSRHGSHPLSATIAFLPCPPKLIPRRVGHPHSRAPRPPTLSSSDKYPDWTRPSNIYSSEPSMQ